MLGYSVWYIKWDNVHIVDETKNIRIKVDKEHFSLDLFELFCSSCMVLKIFTHSFHSYIGGYGCVDFFNIIFFSFKRQAALYYIYSTFSLVSFIKHFVLFYFINTE